MIRAATPFSTATAYTWTALQTFTAGLTVSSGTTTLRSLVVTDAGSGALPSEVATNLGRFATSDATPPRFEYFGFGAAAWHTRSRASGGARSALTALPADNQFITWNSNGYDGSAWSDAGAYNVRADGLWSGTNHGIYYQWTGTPNGSTSVAEWMRLTNAGLCIGAIALAGAERLRVTGGSAPGTPGATDVLVGAGQIRCGDTSATSIQTAGGITAGLSITLSRGAVATITNQCTAAGTANYARTVQQCDTTAKGYFDCYSSTFSGTIFGTSAANATSFLSDGAALTAFFIGCYNVDKPVIFGINTSEVGRFTSGTLASGSFQVKYTGANAIQSSGGVNSISATAGIGYATGAGGTVTQTTSRTTGVTLNAVTGAITLVSAAGSALWQSFTVTNSTVAATDTVIVDQVSGTDLNMIQVTNIAAGSFRISFATTGGVTVEQPVFRFTVIKSVSA